MLHIKIFTFNPFQQNTCLLYNDAGDACIIDPGCYYEYEEEALADFIGEKQLTPSAILLTHAHLDHIFGLVWAAEKYNLTPWLHPMEEVVLKRGDIAAQMFGIQFNLYKGPLQWLADGQTMALGEDEMQVILAPGHSPGSVCFYLPAQNDLIGGDVLFNRSIGRTDLPGGNHEVLLQSIRTRLYTLPNETTVYPGHGPTTTIGEEKIENPYVTA